MAKPRVVFDTNVFVRALINPKGVNARLVRSLPACSVSADCRGNRGGAFPPELAPFEAIRRLDADRLVNLLRLAPMVSPTVKVTVCRDPDDDMFLEAALAAKAEYVVTGDRDLRAIGEYQGVKIRFPAEFLREVEKQS